VQNPQKTMGVGDWSLCCRLPQTSHELVALDDIVTRTTLLRIEEVLGRDSISCAF
jgi:hypothetical protein